MGSTMSQKPAHPPRFPRYFGPTDGNSTITAADFDALIGHSVAVTDAVGSVFAAELIAAYPDAKVILNQRDDIDAWHRSLVNANARVFLSWPVFLVFGALSWLSPDCFWAWQVYVRFMWPGLFRALDGNIATGMERNGKWVYREHYNMVRGLVPKERRLEWTVQDGWEPLCKFLGKDIPDESFPRTNTGAGWAGQESKLMRRYLMGAVRTIVMLTTVAVPAGLIWYKTMR
ncbi:hypothetical protein UCREL1_7776 [Eutypa lata UCREL1]|uniref:Uncharacterized protein n=1 Tax=Eutypa lata (strain UCR-EL1) TaxID=1287681 RepID=M7SG53_EUTLA|nr:hypothetical protein UCREL1_7776 [Eutypa lata UCREL1]